MFLFYTRFELGGRAEGGRQPRPPLPALPHRATAPREAGGERPPRPAPPWAGPPRGRGGIGWGGAAGARGDGGGCVRGAR